MKKIKILVLYKLSNIILISETTILPMKQQHSSLHIENHLRQLMDTIPCWVKEVMAEAGNDMSKYNTHSCRSAASTGALYKGVHIEDILKQGNWSNLKTFKKFYFKNIENLTEPIDFSKKLLENINK